jgi:G3E family GTPase
MANKINLYLITGFLGSGKTTFLLNLLDHFKNEKVGVIMNEFGKIGIDGPIIKKEGMELIEINRGSIFCSCLGPSFAQALLDMTGYPVKHLFIESSGLADPSNIDEFLKYTQEQKGNIYNYMGSICIIDSLYFSEQLNMLPAIERQVKHCDLAVINKADMVEKDDINRIIESIKTINCKAEVQVTSFGKINFNFIDNGFKVLDKPETEDTTNTPDNKPKTLYLKFNGTLKKSDLTEFINSISKDTFRIKGFFMLEDGWNQVDAVNEKLDYKISETPMEESVLVIISKIGPNIIKPIFNSWKNIIGQEMQLKN